MLDITKHIKLELTTSYLFNRGGTKLYILQETISQALRIIDEDQSTARDVLDLPAFSGIGELTHFAAPGNELSQ